MTSLRMFAGVLLMVAGIAVLSAWWFHAGLALTVAGLYVACLDWRNSTRKLRWTLFHGFFQPLVNVAVILWLLAWSTGVDSARPSNGILVDFSALYVGAELALNEPHQLYDLDEQYRRELLHTRLDMEREDFLPYPYPPVVALLLSPLALLSYESAYQVWMVLNLFMVCLSVFLLSWHLKLGRSATQFLALFTSMTLPVYVTLLQGQTSILVLLILGMFFLVFLGHEDRLGTGFWAGLLFIKPPQLLVPLLLLLLRGRWRGLASAGVTSLALLFVSWLMVGSSGMASYLDLLRSMATGRHDAVAFKTMLNIKGAFYYLALPDWAWIAASLVAGGLLSWRYLRPSNSLWSATAAVCLSLLAVPHLYMHDLVIGVIAVAMVLAAHPEGIGLRTRLTLDGIAWVPAAALFFWGLTGEYVPWIPIVMAGLFAYCVWKALDVRQATNGG